LISCRPKGEYFLAYCVETGRGEEGRDEYVTTIVYVVNATWDLMAWSGEGKKQGEL
jgi:hypothetical protein